MRLNLPVVDAEFDYPETQTLVSITDLQGRIVHCNPAFVAVSGFAHDELLGQPHNLIRHPDMPEAAFADLWATLQAGKPWSAPVKNRRKDGRHYWVQANVTPVRDGGRVVGYLAVRTHLARPAVEAAEVLYRQLREAERRGTAPAWRVREGRAEPTGWRGRWAQLTRLPAVWRLGIVALGSGTVAFGAGLWAGAQGGLAPLALAGFGASVMGLAAAAWLYRGTVAPMRAVLHACQCVSAGDLTHRLDASRPGLAGDLARAFNQLGVNLLSVLGDARVEVEQMRLATREIAGGNRDLSGRTEAQAASLEQTAASMEQITATVRQSADSAQQAAELAGQAGEVTQAGHRAVEALAETMQDIRASSQRIGEIIGVIEGIAFQTNLLSLNAAVEAARAGESGRGFAVVASEVRALAGRTAGAAKEVKQLIEASGRSVQAGADRAGAAHATIEQALASVLQVSELVRGISHGATEQLAGISQVNGAVGHLDTITQQNASLVQQVAASAVGLQGRAETVSAAVRVFKLGRDDDVSLASQKAVDMRRAAAAVRETARG
ncbi:MAG: methyl-accepting chemotaxis protein [Pseudomonadota bacterium]